MTLALFLTAALIVAAALLPLVHAVYSAWVRRRHALVGESLVIGGARLHYLRCGAGPLVVLVHGANGTWNDFSSELITELSHGHTVIALDRPGHGWSEAPRGPLGLEQNAAAVLALLRELNAGPATLVGHSYGAAVALRAALDAPEQVSHVVAVCPCTAVDKRNVRYVSAPLIGGPWGGVLFQYIALPLLPFALPLRTEAWYPAPAPSGWGASRAFAYVPSQMHASARNFRALQGDIAWLEERLPKLEVPLTVIAGARDLVTPPARHVEWVRRALPSARIQVLPRAGHWLLRLHPEFIAAAVRNIPSKTAPPAYAQSPAPGGR